MTRIFFPVFIWPMSEVSKLWTRFFDDGCEIKVNKIFNIWMENKDLVCLQDYSLGEMKWKNSIFFKKNWIKFLLWFLFFIFLFACKIQTGYVDFFLFVSSYSITVAISSLLLCLLCWPFVVSLFVQMVTQVNISTSPMLSLPSSNNTNHYLKKNNKKEKNHRKRMVWWSTFSFQKKQNVIWVTKKKLDCWIEI